MTNIDRVLNVIENKDNISEEIENLLWIFKIISDLILIISNVYSYFNIYDKNLFISKSEKFYLFF